MATRLGDKKKRNYPLLTRKKGRNTESERREDRYKVKPIYDFLFYVKFVRKGKK